MLKITPLLLLLLTLLITFTHGNPLVRRATTCETSEGSPTVEDIKPCYEKLYTASRENKLCAKVLLDGGKTSCGTVASSSGCIMTYCGPWDGSATCQALGDAGVAIVNSCRSNSGKAGGTITLANGGIVKVHK